MDKERFIEELKNIGINISEDQLNKLETYYNELIEYNKNVNLTRIVDKDEVYLKHFYDSLTLIKALDLNQELTLCDVGTGAGFPGMVLAIVFPNLSITLVDALQKRITFLDLIIKKLGLTNVKTIHARIEDYAKDNREKYDIVTCRAVSNLRILLEICIPLVKVNGYFIPMKGVIDTELEESLDKFKKLDCELKSIVSFELPIENSKRNILRIIKIKETNHKYPRRYDLIKKDI
jgi:16S rRNA (guanine527-N7)-methyltransferase